MEYQQNNSEYLQLNTTWHQEDAAWKAKQILQAINRNKIEVKTIAEIGCGAGEILVQLQQNLADKTIAFSGLDIALDAIAMAKPKEKATYKIYHIPLDISALSILLTIQ
ncbi:MAG: hypothetical protein KA319_14730 [Ferruginibacter sp.]|nr:hypothetical protein [Ferruginibacter sp.]